ncbi:MAG: hypothetical protein ACP5FH_06775, partial [Terracidiphilus sp.]
MTKGAEAEIPAGLRRVHRKLERWRSRRQGRSPLPEALWRAAAEAAREHGVFRTGQVLHLEYGKLKRVMNATRGKACSPTRFVELAPLAALGGDECVIELEGTRGKLRLRLRGSAAGSLAGLSRA